MSPSVTSRAEPDDMARLTRAERSGVVVTSLTGEIDISNVRGIEAELYGLPNEALGLVLDLSATTFMDSSAVSLVFGLRERLRRRGQMLRIVVPAVGAPRRVLELTGYEHAGPLDLELESAEDAIRTAAGPAEPSDPAG